MKAEILLTKIRIKGREYNISLDTTRTNSNAEDENFAEWLVTTEDGRILEITVWKTQDGSFTKDGIVEAYANKKAFKSGLLLDKKSIKVKRYEDTVVIT